MTRGIHWFRNDLRLHDNLGLSALADRVDAWLPVFIVDPRLVGGEQRDRPRTLFLFDCLERLRADLERRGSDLQILEGDPAEVVPMLMQKTGARVVSWTRGETPFAQRRDTRVAKAVTRAGGEPIEISDHTVFSADEIQTQAGGHYSVFTPYRNEWWRTWDRMPRLAAVRVRTPKVSVPPPELKQRFQHRLVVESDSRRSLPHGGEKNAKRRLREFLSGPASRYAIDRDRPDIDGTSRLSPYLRFGALSIRHCFTEGLRAIEANPSARGGIMKWLDELIWREFYHAVLAHSPHVLKGCYRREYDAIVWRGKDSDFEAWCEGRTGYPFVDAGMRQLKETGWMHNRARMVVASFLTKDLLIDWRRGERFFFDSLVDGDPASNNGGWQWSASTGTDAQPYFRIFNPVTQGKKCDPDGRYVRRWIPELRGHDASSIHTPWKAPLLAPDYPDPIVDHAVARRLALDEYERVRAMRP